MSACHVFQLGLRRCRDYSESIRALFHIAVFAESFSRSNSAHDLDGIDGERGPHDFMHFGSYIHSSDFLKIMGPLPDMPPLHSECSEP